MRRLFVLRPEPGASATAERALAIGLEPVVAPLFAIWPLEWDAPAPDDFDALLLTSANAVRNGGPQLALFRPLPVHAIGPATAETARAAGFTVTTIGDDDIDRLLGQLEPNLKLLHLGGVHRRIATAPRQTITAIPVYEAAAVDRPGLDGIAGSVVMVHSPRAAARLAELVADRGTIALAAISATAAQAAGSGWEQVAVASAPTDPALLATAAELCNKARRA